MMQQLTRSLRWKCCTGACKRTCSGTHSHGPATGSPPGPCALRPPGAQRSLMWLVPVLGWEWTRARPAHV
eukprot:1053493-Pelagomonas_calceolata.AAC.2